MTRKVVYNACFGGFSLSLEAQKMHIELKGKEPKFYEGEWSWSKHWYIEEPYDVCDRNIDRHDPDLVTVVERLGDKASGDCAKLRITEVSGPYRIDGYDGIETVEEPSGLNWL